MNIIFNSIEIEGFMSLGHVNIDLKDSGYTLINGVNNTETDLAKSNGSGKSSIWEALVWCLTGETIRGTKSVENIIQNNGTYVKLTFTFNNDNYIIIRSKNHKQYKTNLLLYVNDKDVSGKGVRNTTKILKDYLPELDNSIISSVIVLGQGLPSRFTNNSPSGRKEVLEQLSKSDFMIEDIKLRIINRKSELDKELRQEQDIQLKTKSECELLQTQLDSDIEQLNSEQDVEQTKQLLIISKEQCNTLQNLVTEIQTECEQINTQINENSLTISSLESQKNEQINELRQKYYNIINPLNIKQTEIIDNTSIENIQLGSGIVNVSITLKDELFYKVLSEISGVSIANEGDLFSIISDLSKTKKEYDKIACALDEVNRKGYGIVTPSIDELILDEPEMVKQGSRFGVKLRANAPSIHMIKANIQTEVSPIVGSEKQSEELVNYLLSEFENDPKKIWESNIFGKSLHELVNEGLQTKLAKMPEDAQIKLQETLERIVNEGSGGLICIIL